MVESATTSEQQRANAAAVTTARVDVWSTDPLRAHERLAYWREAVCRSVFGISIEAPPERFSAWITARSTGGLRFATSESTRYQLQRTRRDIAAAPDDHWSIYLQLEGQTLTTIDDETIPLNAGDIGIYDGRRPLRSLHGGRRTIAVVPRAMVERRAPWLRRNPPRRLADSPYADLARRHLVELATDTSLSESAMTVLADNLCNLVALATAHELEPSRLPLELQIEALLAFCRQHLHEPELTPQRAADHLGISLRTLHSRFRQIGQSFGRWLLENRLEACGVALRDRNHRTSNISEIAYRWGFNDLSHFNKAFRARFDMSPRQWRNDVPTSAGGYDAAPMNDMIPARRTSAAEPVPSLGRWLALSADRCGPGTDEN